MFFYCNCLRCIKPYMYFQIYLFHKSIIEYISSLTFVETSITHTSSRENTCAFPTTYMAESLKSLDCGSCIARTKGFCCVQEKCVTKYIFMSIVAYQVKYLQKLRIFKKESIYTRLPPLFSFL